MTFRACAQCGGEVSSEAARAVEGMNQEIGGLDDGPEED